MEKNQKGLNTRTPAKLYKNPRNPEGLKENQLKSLFKSLGKPGSLKQFAKALLASPDATEEMKVAANRWLYNKRANTKALQRGIGRTSKSKAGNKPGSKPSKKDLDGGRD